MPLFGFCSIRFSCFFVCLWCLIYYMLSFMDSNGSDSIFF